MPELVHLLFAAPPELKCQPRPLTPWEWAGFILGVPLIFHAIMLASARLYGWHELARQFPRVEGQFGWNYKAQSGLIGRVFWSFGLNFIFSKECAVFRAEWPNGYWLKPIFVPWTALRDVGTKKKGRRMYREFELDHPRMRRVLIPEDVMADFESRPAAVPPAS